jgi:hypothetical protein
MDLRLRLLAICFMNELFLLAMFLFKEFAI